MQQAGADFVVWLIIGAIFMMAKAWSKFVTSTDEDAGDEPSPPPPPQPRPERSFPSPRPAPPVAPKPPSSREVAPEELRRFMEQLTKPAQPAPRSPPAAPVIHRAKLQRAKKVPAPPPPTPATPVAAPSLTPTAAATVTAKPQSQRSAQWITALRDRQNLRNIILSAEIIGRPKGLAGSGAGDYGLSRTR
jgi:hypothetical protein